MDESLANVDELTREKIILKVKALFPERAFSTFLTTWLKSPGFAARSSCCAASPKSPRWFPFRARTIGRAPRRIRADSNAPCWRSCMLHRRIYQFFIIYFLGVGLLLALKYGLNLSDYVIPSPGEIWRTGRTYAGLYVLAVLNTLAVAIFGHVVSICLATAVAIIGRLTAWIGSFIRTAAFNIQAYPIVAVAPIIFILLGDGLASRLLIAALICYFPLLLSFIGVFSEPVA